ncbi:hypothetical protein CCUS01_04653 [Colletotrichum cuscutae]|uniref:Uncharacterized protein n=1 Tax=Colletotrichum cuscutae TaxID=1209917 RepID=A0AAI9VC20_9PEZI|nr:hypothetical protein CCUS01_04653 [Colletotrichum cuscutae]
MEVFPVSRRTSPSGDELILLYVNLKSGLSQELEYYRLSQSDVASKTALEESNCQPSSPVKHRITPDTSVTSFAIEKEIKSRSVINRNCGNRPGTKFFEASTRHDALLYEVRMRQGYCLWGHYGDEALAFEEELYSQAGTCTIQMSFLVISHAIPSQACPNASPLILSPCLTTELDTSLEATFVSCSLDLSCAGFRLVKEYHTVIWPRGHCEASCNSINESLHFSTQTLKFTHLANFHHCWPHFCVVPPIHDMVIVDISFSYVSYSASNGKGSAGV